MLLDQIDALATQIGTLTTRIDAAARGDGTPSLDADAPDRAPAGRRRLPAGSTTIERLDEIPGIGPDRRRSSSPRSAST